MKILLIEDEKSLAESVLKYLGQEGYNCEWVANYQSASEKAELYEYDCVLVDVGLPDGNGLGIIKLLKERRSKTGVIVVSAKGAIDDKIKGLEIGADDYLSKPFDLSELNARIKAVIRRRTFEGDNDLQFRDIIISPYNNEVKISDHQVKLTKKEFDLLLFLVSNPNRVLTKEAIAEHLWGDYMDMADSYDFIYAHLKNLRKKLFEISGEEYIQTIHGVGYKLLHI